MHLQNKSRRQIFWESVSWEILALFQDDKEQTDQEEREIADE